MFPFKFLHLRCSLHQRMLLSPRWMLTTLPWWWHPTVSAVRAKTPVSSLRTHARKWASYALLFRHWTLPLWKESYETAACICLGNRRRRKKHVTQIWSVRLKNPVRNLHDSVQRLMNAERPIPFSVKAASSVIFFQWVSGMLLSVIVNCYPVSASCYCEFKLTFFECTLWICVCVNRTFQKVKMSF